jgi:hypothetical protein
MSNSPQSNLVETTQTLETNAAGALFARGEMLWERVDKGAVYLVNLLEETDAENPKYVQLLDTWRGLVKELACIHSELSVDDWWEWKHSGCPAELRFPRSSVKVAPVTLYGTPIQGGLDEDTDEIWMNLTYPKYCQWMELQKELEEE